ncbi:MAG: hypothetical protein WC510_01050 [Candidatus Omnitrophota bacterium]
MPRVVITYIWLVCSGFALGIWLFFSPGTLAVLVLTAGLFCILNLMKCPDRKIIIAICGIAIIARFIFCVFNYFTAYAMGKGADLVGDARAYSSSAQYIAEIATGEPMPTIDGNEPKWLEFLRAHYKGSIPSGGYRVDNFARYVGLIYSVFGYDPIAVKLINSFLSVSTCILLFFLIKDMFSAVIAKIALAISIFWPSMFLWSVTGTKDSLVIFLIILWALVFRKLRKYVGVSEYLLIIAMLITTNYAAGALFFLGVFFIIIIKKFIYPCTTSLIHRLQDEAASSHANAGQIVNSGIEKSILRRDAMFFIVIPLLLILAMKITSEALRLVRFHIFLPFMVAFSIASLVSFMNRKRLILLLIVVICLTLSLPLYAKKYNIDINRHFMAITEKVISIQKSQLIGARSGYRIYPDRFYVSDDIGHVGKITIAEFVISYSKGIAYALFSPFLWADSSKTNLIIYSQMLLYYILFPFLLLGILTALRYKWRDIFYLLIFLFCTLSMYALFEGNIGTVFRHRDILMVIFIIFITIGISNSVNILRINGKIKQAN